MSLHRENKVVLYQLKVLEGKNAKCIESRRRLSFPFTSWNMLSFFVTLFLHSAGLFQRVGVLV